MLMTDTSSMEKEMAVLYVDDDEGTRGMIGRILHLRYCKSRIFFAENGIEGLLKVQEHRPDVIIIDLCLPYLDGFSLAKKILYNDCESNILVVSGCSDEQVIERCLALGIKGYIQKPINFDHFFSLLDGLLGMAAEGNQALTE